MTSLSGKMRDPLKPELTLLMKLGSIVVHCEEFLEHGGHEFDKAAIDSLLKNPDVQAWIKEMGVYLPVKRSKR